MRGRVLLATGLLVLGAGCTGERPERDTAAAAATPSPAGTSREPVVPLDPVAQECVQEVMEALELSWGKQQPDTAGEAKLDAFFENAAPSRRHVFDKNAMLGHRWIVMGMREGQGADEAVEETVTDIRGYVEVDCASAAG